MKAKPSSKNIKDLTDFINNFRVIHHFVKGILFNRRGEYTLTFIQDPNKRWYIDMPWYGNRANLEMVAGADDLLSFLDTERKHSVTIHVVLSKNPLKVEGHTELRQLDKSLSGGSHYDATDFIGFRMRHIWICPVTLCVLGCYPKYIYVKKIS